MRAMEKAVRAMEKAVQEMEKAAWVKGLPAATLWGLMMMVTHTEQCIHIPSRYQPTACVL